MKGTVKWFNNKRGYGFIDGEDEKEYFAHFSNINAEGFRTLNAEQEVQFEPSENEKGLVATEITAL